MNGTETVHNAHAKCASTKPTSMCKNKQVMRNGLYMYKSMFTQVDHHAKMKVLVWTGNWDDEQDSRAALGVDVP